MVAGALVAAVAQAIFCSSNSHLLHISADWPACLLTPYAADSVHACLTTNISLRFVLVLIGSRGSGAEHAKIDHAR